MQNSGSSSRSSAETFFAPKPHVPSQRERCTANIFKLKFRTMFASASVCYFLSAFLKYFSTQPLDQANKQQQNVAGLVCGSPLFLHMHTCFGFGVCIKAPIKSMPKNVLPLLRCCCWNKVPKRNYLFKTESKELLYFFKTDCVTRHKPSFLTNNVENKKNLNN